MLVLDFSEFLQGIDLPLLYIYGPERVTNDSSKFNTLCLQHDCCPIHVASQGKPEVVKLLIEAKCDVNVKDSVS